MGNCYPFSARYHASGSSSRSSFPTGDPSSTSLRIYPGTSLKGCASSCPVGMSGVRAQWRTSSSAIISTGHVVDGFSVSLFDHFLSALVEMCLVIIGCLVWIGLHIVWIYIYVRTGTMPNNRNGANDPHSAWKPFSVTSERVCLHTHGQSSHFAQCSSAVTSRVLYACSSG